MSRIYAVVDCNNFFVSCERVFDPTLVGKPTAVMSNNDGCIVARSAEVKALGIPMGIPVFKCRDEINKHNIALLSSNFSLYGEMSRRVMSVLSKFTPSCEIYSIDEAFLDVSHVPQAQLLEYGKKIKYTVEKWTGIPVSIGIATSKTLAKAANELSKKHSEYGGVVELVTDKDVDKKLKNILVKDVWGVGRKINAVLNHYGIKTAFDLKNADNKWIKKRFTVTGSRTQLELQGIDCSDYLVSYDLRKTVLCSRSFRSPLVDREDMERALSTFAEKAAEKLRGDGLMARCMTVFVMGNRYSADYYAKGWSVVLREPTSFTPDLIAEALSAFDQIYKEGVKYKRAGIVLRDLIAEESLQTDIFSQKDRGAEESLMEVYDRIGAKWGRSKLYYASSIKGASTRFGHQSKSPDYLTSWEDLLQVKAHPLTD